MEYIAATDIPALQIALGALQQKTQKKKKTYAIRGFQFEHGLADKVGSIQMRTSTILVQNTSDFSKIYGVSARTRGVESERKFSDK